MHVAFDLANAIEQSSNNSIEQPKELLLKAKSLLNEWSEKGTLTFRQVRLSEYVTQILDGVERDLTPIVSNNNPWYYDYSLLAQAQRGRKAGIWKRSNQNKRPQDCLPRATREIILLGNCQTLWHKQELSLLYL